MVLNKKTKRIIVMAIPFLIIVAALEIIISLIALIPAGIPGIGSVLYLIRRAIKMPVIIYGSYLLSKWILYDRKSNSRPIKK